MNNTCAIRDCGLRSIAGMVLPFSTGTTARDCGDRLAYTVFLVLDRDHRHKDDSSEARVEWLMAFDTYVKDGDPAAVAALARMDDTLAAAGSDGGGLAELAARLDRIPSPGDIAGDDRPCAGTWTGARPETRAVDPTLPPPDRLNKFSFGPLSATRLQEVDDGRSTKATRTG